MNIRILGKVFKDELCEVYPKEEIQSFFHLLCEAYLGKSRIDIALEPDLEVKPDEKTFFKYALKQLKEEYPIQYIIGTSEFMDLAFEVNEQVLIPRPETEELIRWILASTSNDVHKTILDIGTGSGCIPIILAKHLSSCLIETMDISGKAIEVAKRNALKHKTSIKFIQSDVLLLDSLQNDYDIIVSNPPYVKKSEKKQMRNNVLKYEPDEALYVSDSNPLLFYRHIAKLALQGLKTNGFLFFEINQYHGKELYELLVGLGYKKIEIKKDIHGADRMIRAVKN